MITTKQIKEIKKYHIKVHKKAEPRCVNEALPSFFFNSLFIGITGSGKSYSLVSLLKLYERYGVIDEEGFKCEMRYILISPTSKSDANSVFSLLNIEEDDIIEEFNYETLENKVSELIEEKKMIDEWNLFIKALKKFKKHEDIDEMTDEELEVLEKYGFEDEGRILKRKATKIYFLICDDMISTGLFSRSSKNKFNNLVILCRHHSINIMMTCQHLRSVPPLIRSNCKLYVIFKANNFKKILEGVYEEVSGLLTIEDFEAMYLEATKEMNNHLTIINDKKMLDKYKYRINYDKYFVFVP